MNRNQTEVMVLDTNEESLGFFQRILEAAGFKVSIERSLDAGIARALDDAPHIFIVNVTSFATSAARFFKTRKIDPTLQRIPVLATGELLTDEQIQQAKNWGSSEVLKRPCDARAVLQRVNRVIKERVSLKYEFPKNALPTVELRAQGQIVMANEAGLLIDAPMRLAAKTGVDIQSSLLDKFSCSQAVFRRTLLPAKSINTGFYLNEVAAVGLSPAVLSRIRQTVRNWK